MLETLDAMRRRRRPLRALVQVNGVGERSKSGLAPAGRAEVLALADRLRNVRIVGLMTIPPLAEKPGNGAAAFPEKLRELRDNGGRPETGLDLPECRWA
jgi:uncharacterized pyridoxal phosphate-containing UPF0001 family protein